MALMAGVTLLFQVGCNSDANQKIPNRTMDKHYYQYDAKQVRLPSGLNMAYRDVGEGPQTLVMIHGLGSYLPVWNKLIPSLSSGFRCVALDLPGYGKSDAVADSVSIDFFASQVTEFIKALDLKNITLVGHSMGGQISIQVVLAGEVEVEQLVLLAPAGIETFSATEAAQLKQWVSPASVLALADSQIARNFEINFYENQLPEDANFMYEDRLRLKSDTLAYKAFSKLFTQSMNAMLDGPVFEELSQLKLPVLALFGEDDQLIPNRYLHPGTTTEQIAELAETNIPNAHVKMIPKCGHFVPWEQVEFTSQTILQFIAKDMLQSQ